MASRPERRSLSKQRLPLGRSPRRLGYERRLHAMLSLLSLSLFALAASLLLQARASTTIWLITAIGIFVFWLTLQSWLAEQLLRPLQTLSNVVAALREQDYSFRARGARRGDALGDLALEINALASDLQAERLSSLESAALVQRVLAVMEAPVLAFDKQGILRLLNPAAQRLLRVSHSQQALGQRASALGIEHLLTIPDEQVTTVGGDVFSAQPATQWMVRRSQFREHGVPHTLLLLADVSLALRQEEQQAWRRLIRVLGHEINNSLTPIKSLAGSLRQMLRTGNSLDEFDRPLAVIEERAESLNRFLSAYRQLAQLPVPQHEQFLLGTFLRQLAILETRLRVRVQEGPEVILKADKGQLGQAVINLLRNAAEAALDNSNCQPALTLSWAIQTEVGEAGTVVIRIHDSGFGIANPSNLFVPFYTTKPDGAGVGLALVKQIVEAHHGTIVLASHPEGGAMAELRLPL